MNRKRTVIYLMLLYMSFSILGGGISSQARGKNISLNHKKLTLQVGQSKKLKVKGTSKKVKWSSSNKKVATVSKKGIVKAKKKGKAVITAKVGKWKLNAKVVVKEKKTTRPPNVTSIPSNKPNILDSTSEPKATEKPDAPTVRPDVPTAVPDSTKKPEAGSSGGDISKDEKIPEELQEISSDYFTEADRKGTLERPDSGSGGKIFHLCRRCDARGNQSVP